MRTVHRRGHLPSALAIALLLASLLSMIYAQTGGHSSDIIFSLSIPTAPTLLSPFNGENENDNTPTFTWICGENAENHRLLVDNENTFASPVIDNVMLGASDNTWTKLDNGYADGTYYWKIIAIKGENYNSSSVWTFNVDTLPPNKPTLISPENNKLDNSLSQTFKWTQPPENSLPLTYHIQIDNEASFTLPHVHENSAVTDNTYPYTFSTDGTYYWRIRARDNAGNPGAWADNFKLTLDITPPTAPTLALPENNKLDNILSQTFTWTEPEAGVTYHIQIDNEASFASPYVHENLAVTDNFYPHTFSADGIYYWRVRAKDAANNWGPWADNFKLTLDTTPPDAPPLVWPADGENINGNTLTVDWNAVPDASTPVLYRCYVDNDANFLSVDHDSGWTAATEYTTPELAEGVWYWRVQAKDNAGNVGDNSSRSFRVDVTKPTTPSNVSPVNGENTNDNTPLLDWSDSTDVSLPITYNLYVDNDSNFSSVDYTQTGLTPSQYQFASELAEKVWYWRVQARDNAGNVGDNSTYRSFRVDVTKPQAPALAWPANGENENDNTPALDWNSVSDNSTPVLYRCYVDNNSDFSSVERDSGWISATEYTTPALAEGVWYWKVGAKDNASNVGDNSASRSFRVDTTPPGKPTLASPENNKLDNSLSQTFKWTQPPENSLPLTYHIQIDNEASFTSPYVRENMGVGENSYIYSFTSAGTYYWRVRAKDNAGNWGAWSDNFKLAVAIPVGVSPTKPVLVSPTNGAKTNDNTPTFQWTKGENAENHRLLVDNDLDFSSPVDNILLGAADNTWTKSAPGYVDGTYYWSVVAINAAGENRSLKWAFRVETVPLVAPTSAKWLLIAGILAAVMIGLAVVIYTRRRRVGGKRRGILRGS